MKARKVKTKNSFDIIDTKLSRLDKNFEAMTKRLQWFFEELNEFESRSIA